MAKKMTLLVGAGAIGKAIDSIAKRATRLDYDIQRAACSIVAHVNQHHEVTLVNRLVESLGKGMRANALREWFDTHCACLFDEENQVFVQAKKDDGVPPADMDKVLAAIPWYEHKKEAKFVPVDVSADVAKLIKKVEKALKETDPDKKKAHKCTLGDLAELQVLAAKLGCED